MGDGALRLNLALKFLCLVSICRFLFFGTIEVQHLLYGSVRSSYSFGGLTGESFEYVYKKVRQVHCSEVE